MHQNMLQYILTYITFNTNMRHSKSSFIKLTHSISNIERMRKIKNSFLNVQQMPIHLVVYLAVSILFLYVIH